MRKALLLALALWASAAAAIPLSTVPSFCTTNPVQCAIGGQAQLVARGTGTSAYYVLEVDPTTGELPVSIATGISVDYSGATGAAVPADAAFIGGTDGTNLRGIKTDASGELQVDVLSSALPSGAATSAKQDTAQTSLSAIDSKLGGTLTVAANNFPATANTDYGTPGASTLRSACMLGVGSAAVANGNPVPVSDAGGSITVDAASLPLPTGASTAANQTTGNTALAAIQDQLVNQTTDVFITNPAGDPAKVTSIGKSYADSVRNDYSSTNVTTAAWVQLIASTANPINVLYITDTCGQVLELGTGAAASESRKLLIPRGGMAEPVHLRIEASTRVAIKAVSGNCTTGDFVMTGLN